MIKNETFITKKDLMFISKMQCSTLKVIALCSLGLVGGLYMIYDFLKLFIIWMQESSVLKMADNILMIIYLIAGISFVAMVVFLPQLYAAAMYRRESIRSKHLFVFTKEEFIGYVENQGIKNEEHFNYSIVEKYYLKNQAIYLKLKFDKKHMYIVLHNDSYIEGSKEELIALLSTTHKSM